MPHHFENLSMINAYTGRCRRLFTVYFVRKPVGKMDWFWFCWSAMTSHTDREYLAGKGCQFRPSVKGNNYHISNINFHWRNRKSKNQNLSLHQTWYLKFRYSVMYTPTCKFKKTSICNRFLYLKQHNVHRVRILYIHVYLAIDKIVTFTIHCVKRAPVLWRVASLKLPQCCLPTVWLKWLQLLLMEPHLFEVAI